MAFVNPFLVDKTVNSTVNNNITFDTDITFDKDFNADIDIDAFADIDGNISTLTLDAEAIGTDTLVEVDSSVLSIHGELSSVSLSVISAVAPKTVTKPDPEPAGIDIVGNKEPFFFDQAAAAGTQETLSFADVDDVNPTGILNGIYPIPDPIPGLPDLPAGPGDAPISLEDFNLVSLGPIDPLLGNYVLDSNFDGTATTETTFTFGPEITLNLETSPGVHEDVTGTLEIVFFDGTLFNVSNPGADETEVSKISNIDAELRFGGFAFPVDSVLNAQNISGGTLPGDYTFQWETQDAVFKDPALV